MSYPLLAIFLGIAYGIIIVAIFIVFIRVLKLLEGELYNQRRIDEQRGNREALIEQAPDVCIRRP
jgi:hypothetical protein